MNDPSLAEGKVSIVIPCYNHGGMLLEALASIEQARSETIAEVIVVNDGSNDPETCQILRDLDATKYRVVNQSAPGVARARNAGIELAGGEFIVPLDSDNLIRGAYFDKGVAHLLQNPEVGVVYGDAEYFGEKTGPLGESQISIWGFWSHYIDACAPYRKRCLEISRRVR